MYIHSTLNNYLSAPHSTTIISGMELTNLGGGQINKYFLTGDQGGWLGGWKNILSENKYCDAIHVM